MFPSKAKRIVGYFFYVVVAVIFLSEIGLRIWSPFEFRQNDHRVILPRNRKMVFDNDKIPVLDRKIVHTKNSLGFRGMEPPAGDLSNYFSIIAIGGSATECFYLSDDDCWTSLLEKRLKSHIRNVWVNNAGFQGHSTHGNFILINEYVKTLKPRYVLLMEGINEINRYDLLEDESVSIDADKITFWGWLKRNSRVVSTVLNIQRHLLADRLSVTDNNTDFRNLPELHLPDSIVQKEIARQLPLLKSYERRLNRILDTCLANGIEPLIITQPILYGEGNDCVTGIDLGKARVADEYNGQLIWRILELFNDITRKTAQKRGIHLIDLARSMPKCSRYYYDICHFTKEGSLMVSEILSKDLIAHFVKAK